jgi:hypothetical protein
MAEEEIPLEQAIALETADFVSLLKALRDDQRLRSYPAINVARQRAIAAVTHTCTRWLTGRQVLDAAYRHAIGDDINRGSDRRVEEHVLAIIPDERAEEEGTDFTPAMDAGEAQRRPIDECAVFENLVEAERNIRLGRFTGTRNDMKEINARWEAAWREADKADKAYAAFVTSDTAATPQQRIEDITISSRIGH